MKLSIFTTISNPDKRGDNWHDALACYKDLADELYVIDGGGMRNNSPDYGYLYQEWPREFDWPLIGRQFQRGYEACTDGWVIHADLDFIFHENDYKAIRKALEDHDDAPALSFWKYQFILPDRYTLKSRLVIAVNKGKYGDRIKFDSGGDLAQPSLDGKYISPDDVPEARVPFYNYEKILKTKEQIMDDCGRMDRAYYRHFGKYQLSKDGTDESAYEGWLKMNVGRFNARSQERIRLEEHPKVMQETIKNLRPDQWGYDGFGYLPRSDYAS